MKLVYLSVIALAVLVIAYSYYRSTQDKDKDNTKYHFIIPAMGLVIIAQIFLIYTQVCADSIDLEFKKSVICEFLNPSKEF